jgi:hypothetical protein
MDLICSLTRKSPCDDGIRLRRRAHQSAFQCRLAGDPPQQRVRVVHPYRLRRLHHRGRLRRAALSLRPRQQPACPRNLVPHGSSNTSRAFSSVAASSSASTISNRKAAPPKALLDILAHGHYEGMHVHDPAHPRQVGEGQFTRLPGRTPRHNRRGPVSPSVLRTLPPHRLMFRSTIR